MRAAMDRAGLPRRCAATSRRSGEQCKNAPIPGGTVCKFHGGSAPQTKRKAALRLASLVDPAIGTLAREMVKAERSSDRQRAANSILDRAGISRSQDVELETARALLIERLLAARAAPAAGDDDLVLEAEVVIDAPAASAKPKKGNR